MSAEDRRDVDERISEAFRRLREVQPHTDPKPLPAEQRVSGWYAPDELHNLQAEAQAAREAYSEYLREQNPGIIPLPSLEGNDGGGK